MKLRRLLADQPEIDLVPLVACAFLLLSLLLVLNAPKPEAKPSPAPPPAPKPRENIRQTPQPAERQAFNIELPEAQKPQSVPAKDAIVISVTAAGEFYVGRRKVGLTELLDEVRNLGPSVSPDKPVVIHADYRTEYVNVVTVIDALYQAGISRYSLAVKRSQ